MKRTRQLSGTGAPRWILLLLLTLPGLARAQFNYQIFNGTVSITGGTNWGGYCFSEDVTIPSTIQGLPVTSIRGAAFYQCGLLTNVTIPGSITNIGYEAFSDCPRLEGIVVDADNPTYASVDGVLFDKARTTLIQCPGGRTGHYTIPSGVTNLGASSISRCRKLTSVTIPGSVTSIGNFAFNNCTSLASAMIPSSVLSIGNWTFHYCTSLTNVTISNGVTWIGTEAFLLCRSLTSVTIPSSVTNIEPGAFLCPLVSIFFQGDAPTDRFNIFYASANPTVYYLPGTRRWGPTFGGHQTVLWNPQISTNGTRFGPLNDRFGFEITGTSNLVIVVEVCPDLTHPVWSPVGTNVLTDGLSYFSDPQWTSRSTSFYRLRSQ